MGKRKRSVRFCIFDPDFQGNSYENSSAIRYVKATFFVNTFKRLSSIPRLTVGVIVNKFAQSQSMSTRYLKCLIMNSLGVLHYYRDSSTVIEDLQTSILD